MDDFLDGLLSFKGAVVVIILVVIAIIGYNVALVSSRETVTLSVTDKERTGGDNGEYLVYTDSGTYKITDSLIAGRFDSSDVYGDLETPSEITAVRQGWRLPFFSEYPNLIEIEQQ